MTREKIELLQKELLDLQLAAGNLGYSMERCLNLIDQEELPPEQLERLESLTSRFARLADLFIIAIPSANKGILAKILQDCRNTGIPTQIFSRTQKLASAASA